MYVCPKCKSKIELENTQCKTCKLEYTYKDNKLEYNYDLLLFNKFKNKFLRNKALNNNGLLSYLLLPEGSLSIDDRADVQRFRDFIEKKITNDKKYNLLDIGCGMLELPGYLNFKNIHNIEFYGIEPIKESNFKGNLIIGCSEFVPLQNNSMDFILFATSLDHVCSIEHSIEEVSRILAKNGKVIIWMSDRSINLVGKVKRKLKIVYDYIRYGYRTDIYHVYDDYRTVLEVPRGGIDPFHSFFESPQLIEGKFKKYGFKLVDKIKNNNDEVFLEFSK